MHGKYRISDRVSKGDQIYLGPLSNDHPSMIIISNDNLWLPLTPVTIRGINFTFHHNWYIRIPELTSPYDFALANYNRLLETKLMNGYTYSNREMIIPSSNPLMSISFPHNHSTPTVSKTSSIGSFGSTIILPRSASHTT